MNDFFGMRDEGRSFLEGAGHWAWGVALFLRKVEGLGLLLFVAVCCAGSGLLP